MNFISGIWSVPGRKGENESQMKRVVLFGIMLMLFCSGCSAKEEPKQEKEQQEQIQTQSTENTEIEDGEDAKTDTETEESGCK